MAKGQKSKSGSEDRRLLAQSLTGRELRFILKRSGITRNSLADARGVTVSAVQKWTERKELPLTIVDSLLALINRVLHTDVLEGFKLLPDKSVDAVISSPPYWQLRDYKFEGQWGLEPDYRDYLSKLWSMMDEVWRVLRDEGTVWINLADTYGTFRGKSGGGADSFERAVTGSRYKPKSRLLTGLIKNEQLEKCLRYSSFLCRL